VSQLNHLTNERLVLQLQGGDLDALGALYDRHRFMVYRTALAITNDVETASDLLQDVFLRMYRFSHRIDPQRPLEPWLYRVTVNLAYTWMNRRNRMLRCLQEIAEWMSRERKPTPHLQAERHEEWRWVQQAVASLPMSQRVVVVMYYINDLSLQEIADILEIPVGTVKSRLYYGRRALKNKLGLHREVLSEVNYEFL
jgi:RNA polymerase sigma-70 factor (ECF subfamily)